MQSQQKTNRPTINEDGNLLTDPNDIANAFNKFFTSVSSKYGIDDNPNEENEYSASVKDLVSSKLCNGVTFQIPEVTEDYVFKSLISMDATKATGLDGISAYFLKVSAGEITKSITHVLNSSIGKCVFPTQWKKLFPFSKMIQVLK